MEAIKLVNIDKIYDLAKDKGIKLSHICSKLGVARTYLADARNKKTIISEDKIKIIADVLSTTPDYLNDNTDKKEKPVTDDGNELEAEATKLFSQLPPELQEQAMRHLRFLVAEEKAKSSDNE